MRDARRNGTMRDARRNAYRARRRRPERARRRDRTIRATDTRAWAARTTALDRERLAGAKSKRLPRARPPPGRRARPAASQARAHDSESTPRPRRAAARRRSARARPENARGNRRADEESAKKKFERLTLALDARERGRRAPKHEREERDGKVSLRRERRTCGVVDGTGARTVCVEVTRVRAFLFE